MFSSHKSSFKKVSRFKINPDLLISNKQSNIVHCDCFEYSALFFLCIERQTVRLCCFFQSLEREKKKKSVALNVFLSSA